jgi:hypothetical protein
MILVLLAKEQHWQAKETSLSIPGTFIAEEEEEEEEIIVTKITLTLNAAKA